MAPCLSKFPSLCLEAIFKHVPVEDLLRTVGLVCTNWYKSRLTELMRRRRLVIVEDEQQLETFNCDLILGSYETDLIQHVRRDGGAPWLTLESRDHIKFDALIIPDCMLNISTSSLTFMSNITDFSFVSGDASKFTIIQVIRLLRHFSEHLVFLKLSFKFNESIYKKKHEKELVHNMTALFACFNRLLSLRHFRFDIYQKHLGPFNNIRLDMSFLSRLTTVSIFFDEIDGSILSSLGEHALNVGSIDLHQSMELEELLKVDRKLDTKFNVLSMIGLDTEDFDDMKMFSTRFNSLTKLNICSFCMPMVTLAQCLAQLSQLVHVTLSYPELVVDEEDDDEEEDENRERAQPEFSQVPSVRMLTFSLFDTQSHLYTEQFFIAEIFPNLQALRFQQQFTRCTDCEIIIPFGTETFPPELNRQVVECKRLGRQPFRRCAHLHTVELSYYYHELDVCKETLTDINEL